METGVLEINDCSLRVFCGTDLLLESPGVAGINGQHILVGAPALLRARSHPMQANSHFWRNLNLEPINSKNPACRHHADLAFHQLQEIAKQRGFPPQIVLVVPGNFTREQLALLLGILKASAIHAVALADNASLCISNCAPPGSHLHIELHRHQTLVSRILVGKQAKLESTETINEAGLEDLQNSWARMFTDAFIRQCRFDPLHAADSEQLLYNRLPQWIKQAAHRGEVVAELIGHSAKLSLRQLQEASRPILAKIGALIDGSMEAGSIVFLSHRWAEVPGAVGLTRHTQLMPADCIARATVQHWHEISSDDKNNLRLITTLPSLASDNRSVQEEADEKPPAATHLLFANRALSAKPALFVYRQNSQLKLATTPPELPAAIISNNSGHLKLDIDTGAELLLNGEKILAPVNLKPGDSLSARGIAEAATAISVEPYDTQE